ncbi:competence protein ComEC [Thermosipho sp. 1063]|uniref:ComEC/Rec2 family competence protein n=1 Tax=unclassified Thermosipho (in: thermotogales) TaxID=2676525 RepID=UPI00094936D6|nr:MULTISPECIES: ComEC/Rec2 family competence protein [unclassified Thermosipho (in: thermotogales)]ANQ54657.1 competence protein ComEC [Thermosipho sp. 1070]APT73060.1 competence protein ComEC [Thermosipho sp. 1063]OOC42149.1 competence protein ComEC [Thermosipho sp. 1074]
MFLILFFVGLIGALLAPIFSVPKLFLFIPFLFWKNKKIFFILFVFLIINFYGGLKVFGTFEYVGRVIQTNDNYSLVFGKIFFENKWISLRMLVGINEELPLGDIVYYYGDMEADNFSYPKVKLDKNRVISSPYFSIFRNIYMISENFRKKLLKFSEIYYGLFGGKVKRDYIKNSGMYHFFSISGMHISIIYAFFLFLFSKFELKEYLSLAFSFLFLIATGINLPALRAFLLIFFSTIFEGKMFNKIDILCVIGLLFLFIEPALAFSLSFYMSFFSTFGILFVENKYLKMVSAFLGSAPFLALFTNINLFSIIGTFILVIPFQILLFVLLIAFVFELFSLSIISEFLLKLFLSLTNIIESTLKIFATLPKVPGGIYTYLLFELFFFVFLLHFGHIPYILKSKSSN